MVGISARHSRRTQRLTFLVVNDVLYPATDAGATGQILGVVAVTLALVWFGRGERALVTFTIGIALVLLGFFGLRAVH
jgi:hypothetical protein